MAGRWIIHSALVQHTASATLRCFLTHPKFLRYLPFSPSILSLVFISDGLAQMHDIWDAWVKFFLASGFASAGLGALGINDALAIGGFLAVLATFIVNWRFKAKAHRLDLESFEFDKARLKDT